MPRRRRNGRVPRANCNHGSGSRTTITGTRVCAILLSRRTETEHRLHRGACRDDDQVRAFGVGERNQRLFRLANDELGANAGRALGRCCVRIELGTRTIRMALVLDHMDEDDFGFATLRGKGARNFERRSAPGRQVCTADDGHKA